MMTEKRRDGESRLEQLIRLAQNTLSPSDKEALQKRIDQDEDLAALYRFLQEILQKRNERFSRELADAEVAEAPGELSLSAERLGMKLFSDFQKRKANPTKMQAITMFDSRDLPLPAGVRPAAVDKRNLKYQLPDGIVEIALHPVSFGSYELTGMISHSRFKGEFEIRLTTGKRESRLKSDEYSVFLIPRLPSGEHTLQIYADSELLGTIELQL